MERLTYDLGCSMPVYRNHRIVHIHIPKTAGTAIDAAVADIGDMTWDEHSWYGVTHANGRFWEYQHLTFRELRTLSGGAFDSHAAFAVVRDPFARLVSDFEWRRQVARNGDPDSGVIDFDDFGRYLASIPTDMDHNWERYVGLADRRQTNHLVHVRPQWQYLCDQRGERDERIIVLRFETLRDDFDVFARQHGLNVALPPRPPTLRRLDDYFDDDAVQRVLSTYRTDFDWFGYEPRLAN